MNKLMKNLEILVWNYQFSLYTKRRNISHSKYVSDSRHSFQFQTKINLWKKNSNRPKSNFDCLDLNVRVGCFILRQINVNKKRSKWVMAMMKTYFSRFDTKLYFPLNCFLIIIIWCYVWVFMKDCTMESIINFHLKKLGKCN